MQPSPPTQPKTFSSSWTVSGRPSKILGWPSAWRRHSYGSECGLTSQHCNLETWTGGCQWLRISDTLSLKSELNKRIGKAATTISKLTKSWVLSNKKLTENTKIQVYRACVLSTLLYGGESRILHARQEKKLNTFHMRCLRRILNITWQDRVPNDTVLEWAEIPSMYTLLKQRRLRWFGHVLKMDKGPFPKNLLYGQLAKSWVKRKRSTGRLQLRY